MPGLIIKADAEEEGYLQGQMEGKEAGFCAVYNGLPEDHIDQHHGKGFTTRKNRVAWDKGYTRGYAVGWKDGWPRGKAMKEARAAEKAAEHEAWKAKGAEAEVDKEERAEWSYDPCEWDYDPNNEGMDGDREHYRNSDGGSAGFIMEAYSL